jgi:hypothetical protein
MTLPTIVGLEATASAQERPASDAVTWLEEADHCPEACRGPMDTAPSMRGLRVDVRHPPLTDLIGAGLRFVTTSSPFVTVTYGARGEICIIITKIACRRAMQADG